jgi:hypothetical protein
MLVTRETEWPCLYSECNGNASNSGSVSATKPADARLGTDLLQCEKEICALLCKKMDVSVMCGVW